MRALSEIVGFLLALIWAAVLLSISFVVIAIAAVVDFICKLPSGFWIALAIFAVVGVML